MKGVSEEFMSCYSYYFAVNFIMCATRNVFLYCCPNDLILCEAVSIVHLMHFVTGYSVLS